MAERLSPTVIPQQYSNSAKGNEKINCSGEWPLLKVNVIMCP